MEKAQGDVGISGPPGEVNENSRDYQREEAAEVVQQHLISHKGARMEFKRRTLNQIADMICGNAPEANKFFVYRSSKYLTEFFEDTETDYVHDGSTRQWWVAETLAAILSEPQPDANTPPDTFARVIQHLMDQEDALNEERERPGALEMLNATLAWIGNKLDVLKRSQIMFMERDDILNLFVVTNLPLPRPAWPSASVFSDEPPF